MSPVPTKRIGSFLFLIAMHLFFLSGSQGWAMKPQGPLSLGLSAVSDPKAPGVIEVSFTVTPRLDSPEVEIYLELPDDLPLVEGSEYRVGPARKGEPIILLIRVGPVIGKQEIIGRAVLRYPEIKEEREGSIWSQSGSILISPESAQKPIPRIRVNRTGRAVLEIPVR